MNECVNLDLTSKKGNNQPDLKTHKYFYYNIGSIQVTGQRKIAQMMISKRITALFCFISVLLLLVIPLHAEAGDPFRLLPDPKLSVVGTSTLHDWEMNSGNASGNAVMTIEESVIKQIEGLTIRMSAASLQSGNNRMDRIAHDAIRAPEFPYVEFFLESIESITVDKITGNGKFTVAGNDVSLRVITNYSVQNNSVHFSGIQAVKFSDFGIKPPTALLGTLRTGDDLLIQYSVRFIRVN